MDGQELCLLMLLLKEILQWRARYLIKYIYIYIYTYNLAFGLWTYMYNCIYIAKGLNFSCVFICSYGIDLQALMVFALILALGLWFCATFIADVCGLFLSLPKIVVSRYDDLFLTLEAWRTTVFALLEYNSYHHLN